MSDNVVALGSRSTLPGPHKDVVDKLERALEKAKRGEIRAIAIASVLGNGAAGASYDSGDLSDWPTLLGSVMLLQQRMLTDGLGND